MLIGRELDDVRVSILAVRRGEERRGWGVNSSLGNSVLEISIQEIMRRDVSGKLTVDPPILYEI